jgi:hypothetical protein
MERAKSALCCDRKVRIEMTKALIEGLVLSCMSFEPWDIILGISFKASLIAGYAKRVRKF